MKNDYMENLVAGIKSSPEASIYLKAAYPRRIVTPDGYTNPVYYAVTAASSIMMAISHGPQVRLDFVKSCVHLMTKKLVKLHTPTCFLGHEFAEAVDETGIESNIRLDEITWPDEAMLFCFPDKFSLETFGFVVPFLAVAHYSQSDIAELKGLKLVKPDGTPSDKTVKDYPSGQVMMHFQWYQNKQDSAVDYVSSWPAHTGLADMERQSSETRLCLTDEEERIRAQNPDTVVGMSDEEVERRLINRLRSFTAKLLLAMTAEPGFLERGALQRAAKFKRGKLVREELWSPHFLGRNYHHPRSESEGTHASPRLHRRMGHFRDQHYGSKNISIKRLWIKPTWVGAKLTNTGAV